MTSVMAARPPRRTQAQRSEETRARLLEAAIAVLAEEGYAAATSARVCERAGYTRGAQIHHFPSQALLMQAAVERLSEQAIAAFDAQMAAASTTANGVADPLDAFLYGIWRTLEGPLFATAVELMVAARTDAGLLRVLQPGLDRLEAVIAARVSETARTVRPGDPQPLATMLEVSVRLVHGVALDALLAGLQPRHHALWDSWTRQVRAQAAGAGP